MKKNFLMLPASLLLILSSFAQNIGINADGTRPNSNAILDIKSGTKGLLIPRMDSVARKAIPNTRGLLVYDISTDNFWFNTGKVWECIPKDKDRNKGGDAWLLKGNNNTRDGVDFLGTTNDMPLNIRVNNQPSGRIDSALGNAFWGYHSGGSGGFYNTAIGYRSMYSNSQGYYNASNGFQSMYSNTTGFSNTASGMSSLHSNTAGAYNTANGFESMYNNTTGNANTAYGTQALYSCLDGNASTAVGYGALYRTTAGGNTGIGFYALNGNTTGSSNTATGNFASSGNTTGNNNLADGYYALSANTTGSNNTASGSESLRFNASGSNNSGQGYQSLYANIDGNFNTATGSLSLAFNSSGSSNTSNGYFSMYRNTTGQNNTAVGEATLYNNITGSDITALGYQANVSSDGLSNATALGSGAIVDASNKVRIGNGAVTVIEGQVPFTTPSDGRYKFNVAENVKGLDFILHLRPVTYQFDTKRFDAKMNYQPGKDVGPANYALQAGYDEATRIRRSGFIAQEVEQAANASGYDFSGIIKPKSVQDHYSLSYDAFVVPLVKAVQEQQAIIETLHKKLAAQQQAYDTQYQKMAELQRDISEIKKLLQRSN